MAELTFISNKTRKDTYKYFFVIIFALITWILQVSIASTFMVFDSTPNFILLGSIYFGLLGGPLNGTLFGIISSFFCTSTLYDHTFYFSYPLIGLLSGLLSKKLFSDELLFFIFLVFIFTFPLEIVNGWQYSFKNQINILDRWLLISIISATVNLFISPFYYWLMKYITTKLKLW